MKWKRTSGQAIVADLEIEHDGVRPGDFFKLRESPHEPTLLDVANDIE